MLWVNVTENNDDVNWSHDIRNTSTFQVVTGHISTVLFRHQIFLTLQDKPAVRFEGHRPALGSPEPWYPEPSPRSPGGQRSEVSGYIQTLEAYASTGVCFYLCTVYKALYIVAVSHFTNIPEQRFSRELLEACFHVAASNLPELP